MILSPLSVILILIIRCFNSIFDTGIYTHAVKSALWFSGIIALLVIASITAEYLVSLSSHRESYGNSVIW